MGSFTLKKPLVLSSVILVLGGGITGDQPLSTLSIVRDVGVMSKEFKEKLKSIQFSAGAKTYPKNYYDNQALEQLGFTDEGREEHLDVTEGTPLKWDKKTPYLKDKAGDYVKATDKDMTRVMYGSPRREKEAGR